MRLELIITLFLVSLFCCNLYSYEKSSAFQVADSQISLLIKKAVNKWRVTAKGVIEGEQIYSVILVEGFYQKRDYKPAWSEDGRVMQAEQLVKAVEEAYGDGLTPDHYHLNIIKSLVSRLKGGSYTDPVRLASLDMLLTDAFLTLSCHLSGGCVNPLTFESGWFAKRKNVDVSSALEQALTKKQIREALARLRPAQASYDRLRQALALYRELSLKGEWPLISAGPSLKRGLVSDRVAELRRRLVASGDLEAEANGGDFFDSKLRQSVIIFQKRHGLKTDGIVGSATLGALNVSLRDRIRQIELNMERLRWILGSLEQRSIVVNIANFQLDVVENGESILSMKVVIGKRYWDTPIFTAKMTGLIINPSWSVPDSIARKEVLKKIMKDPHYLAEQNIKVLKGWGYGEEEIDRETIDWSKIPAGTLLYRFRQEPGPLNPLGRLKFMLPNKFDVYLHDTPAKRLFSENVRMFSHGCIRIEKPIELAEYVLQDDPRWTREKLLSSIEKGAEQKVPILHPINVHFLYLTSWVDEKGIIQFRDDIYGRDKRLDEALRKNPSLDLR